MALSKEDHGDVKRAFGKALARKVLVATKDGSTHKFDNLKHYGNDNKRSLVSRDTPRYKNIKSYGQN